MIDYAFYLGLIAATLTTVAFLPQAIKIWKLKEAKDISLTTFSIFSTGVLMWLFYGLLIKDFAITLANSITFIVAMSILFFKIRYG